MNDRPDKCQYCECSGVASDHNHARRFLCGTIWNIEHQSWHCCINCARLCVTPLMELRKRVAKAVEALKAVPRYAMEADSHLAVLPLPDRQGDWVWREDIDAVRDILEGNSPEIPEGSA